MTIRITTKDLREYPLISIDPNSLYATIQTDTGIKTILTEDIITWKIDSDCPVVVIPGRGKK